MDYKMNESVGETGPQEAEDELLYNIETTTTTIEEECNNENNQQHNEFIGDKIIETKPEGTYRVYGCNPNGIQVEAKGGE